MTLRKLYIKGLIFPSIIAIASTGILSAYHNSDYKSEWLTKESVIFMSVSAAFVYSLIICVLGLTVFLNNKIIKTRGSAAFLSWFLLPMTFIIIAIVKTTDHRLNYETRTTGQLFYLITLNLPFVIGLIWTYILFLKNTSTRPLDDN